MVPGIDLTRRRLAVLLVLLLTVSAGGVGVLQLDQAPTGPTRASMPPPPAVSPPGDEPAQSPAGPTTAGPVTTTAVTTNSTTSPGSVTVSLAVTDPDDVQSTTGDVDLLNGRLTGTIDWSVRNASSLSVVVSTWTPRDGWTTKRTITRNVSDAGSVGLGTLLDNPVVYAAGARADAFTNSEDGTTVVRESYVAVTAFLMRGDAILERQRAMGDYAFSVTNLEETATTSETTPALSVSGQPLFSVRNTAPGGSGRGETVVKNAGEAPGELDVVLEAVESTENDLIEPERSVDRPGNGGELAAALDVRIVLVREDTRTYVVGGPASYVPVASLEPGTLAENVDLAPGESARLVAEWRIPTTVGNEIQTDSVSVTVSYVLTSA